MSRTPSSAKPVTFGQPVTNGNEEDFENPRVQRLSVSREPTSYSHYNAVQFQREFNNRSNPPFVVEYPISSEAANQVVKKVGIKVTENEKYNLYEKQIFFSW